ncbi:MAG: nucleotidyltransferase family protein [Gammaproteobacteria bacterium]|nr:nucleotidyltransferase family protein [Gammaproteobacteria bacterium]
MSSSDTATLDAIVLAGTDDNPRRMIQGQNKAFLEIGGRSLVERAVSALLAAESIGQVFVVGPVERLQQALGPRGGRVSLVPQVGKMLANAWEAIHASEAQSGQDDPLRPLLFISSDLPLVSAAAIDDFVRRCRHEDALVDKPYSMLAGVAEEASLEPYYPSGERAGIVRPYVHLEECRVRLANIYVGRPRSLTNPAFLQTGFEHRKAEKWKNVLGLAWRFLSQDGGLNAAWVTLKLQATLLAAPGGGHWYRRLRAANTVERIESACSRVIGGGVRMVISPYGGLSLDADNEDDFRVISARFEDWVGIDPVGS